MTRAIELSVSSLRIEPTMNCAFAVIDLFAGRERRLTRESLRLQSHFLFREHFCLVRRANEKGRVERLCGTEELSGAGV